MVAILTADAHAIVYFQLGAYASVESDVPFALLCNVSLAIRDPKLAICRETIGHEQRVLDSGMGAETIGPKSTSGVSRIALVDTMKPPVEEIHISGLQRPTRRHLYSHDQSGIGFEQAIEQMIIGVVGRIAAVQGWSWREGFFKQCWLLVEGGAIARRLRFELCLDAAYAKQQ